MGLTEERAELQERLDANELALAEKLAAIEQAENSIEDKRGRDPEDPDRAEELRAEVAKLVAAVKHDRERLRELRPRHKKLVAAIAKVSRQIRNAASPKVIDLGAELSFRPMAVNPSIDGSIGHYTAGVDDVDDADAVRLWRLVHAAHLAQGWSGIGYHIGITCNGTIVLLRPMRYVGSHTMGKNTGQVGFTVHGTTGDTWERAQLRGFRRALKKFDLKSKPVTVHKDWYPTACPGSFESGYRAKGKS